jgi:uncharacterized coiled-coil DUF342 family protein
MTSKSGIHAYTEWAKGRLDEMDAAVTSMEAGIKDLQSQARKNAESALADLKAKRDAFSAQIDETRAAGGSAWADINTQMEANWNAFEQSAKSYMDAATGFADENRAAFLDRAEAQMKAWQDAAEKLQGAATDFGDERKADVEAAVAKLKAEADSARARVDTLGQAGTESWGAMMKALSDSREAFEKANSAAFEAFKRAFK